jgi:hypothetical protein
MFRRMVLPSSSDKGEKETPILLDPVERTIPDLQSTERDTGSDTTVQ